MRRTLYAIAALALITTTACNKKDEDINNVPDKGAIRFINTSNDLYDFYLDDIKYGDMYGNDSSTFYQIAVGAHRVKAIQAANIVGTATQREQILIVQKDSLATFRFP